MHTELSNFETSISTEAPTTTRTPVSLPSTVWTAASTGTRIEPAWILDLYWSDEDLLAHPLDDANRSPRTYDSGNTSPQPSPSLRDQALSDEEDNDTPTHRGEEYAYDDYDPAYNGHDPTHDDYDLAGGDPTLAEG
jgi:hypothetical protein